MCKIIHVQIIAINKVKIETLQGQFKAEFPLATEHIPECIMELLHTHLHTRSCYYIPSNSIIK